MATFVLIHGAGDVGWYWHLVEAGLRQRGHDTVSPDLPCDDDSAGRASVRAEQLQQEALALATHGEPLTVIERKLDAARQVFDEAEPAMDADGSHFTIVTLQLRSAAVYTEAGVPDRAAGIFEGILNTGSLSRRDTGLFGARRAVALALSGHPDEAATVALGALGIAKATSSGRTLTILSDVVTTLAPWRARPGPREFREAMLA